MTSDHRLVVAMTGATGQIFGIKILQLVAQTEYESHLVLSDASKINLNHETEYDPGDVMALADETHEIKNIGASIASGSFRTAGMIVAPCSMKTLSNIAHANSGNLITRAADVTLKERRPLVLMPREKPLNRIHLKNMLDVTDAGGIIMPPQLSFYQNDDDLETMVGRTAARALSMLDIHIEFEEWAGISATVTDS